MLRCVAWKVGPAPPDNGKAIGHDVFGVSELIGSTASVGQQGSEVRLEERPEGSPLGSRFVG